MVLCLNQSWFSSVHAPREN